MKLTKSKLQQIIKEELEEIGIEGGDPAVAGMAANVVTSFIGAIKAVKNGETFNYPVNPKIGSALARVADSEGYIVGSSPGVEEQRLQEGFFKIDPKILLGIGILIGVLLIVAMALGYTVKIDCESSKDKEAGMKKRGCTVDFIGPEGKESAEQEPVAEPEQEPVPLAAVAEGVKRSKRLSQRRKK